MHSNGPHEPTLLGEVPHYYLYNIHIYAHINELYSMMNHAGSKG